jgi:hypothetical protein
MSTETIRAGQSGVATRGDDPATCDRIRGTVTQVDEGDGWMLHWADGDFWCNLVGGWSWTPDGPPEPAPVLPPALVEEVADAIRKTVHSNGGWSNDTGGWTASSLGRAALSSPGVQAALTAQAEVEGWKRDLLDAEVRENALGWQLAGTEARARTRERERDEARARLAAFTDPTDDAIKRAVSAAWPNTGIVHAPALSARVRTVLASLASEPEEATPDSQKATDPPPSPAPPVVPAYVLDRDGDRWEFLVDGHLRCTVVTNGATFSAERVAALYGSLRAFTADGQEIVGWTPGGES